MMVEMWNEKRATRKKEREELNNKKGNIKKEINEVMTNEK